MQSMNTDSSVVHHVLRHPIGRRNTRSLLVPTEHGIDGLGKLRVILLVNAASIYPEVSQAISCRLFRAKPYLVITSLALPGAGFYVLKADLLAVVCGPSMREYCIGRDRDIFAGEFA